MLNELSDYFFSQKIYNTFVCDLNGSIEEDNLTDFSKPITHSPYLHSYNLVRLNDPFIYDWVQHIKNMTNCSSCQLQIYYPPSGFLGWHTNDDAKGYNVLLTYSRSDKSYLETHNNKIYDKIGWSAKINHFHGTSNWHRVVAADHRISFAFLYDTEEKSEKALKKLQIKGVINWDNDI